MDLHIKIKLYPNANTFPADKTTNPPFTTIEHQSVTLESEYSELEARDSLDTYNTTGYSELETEDSIEMPRGNPGSNQATASETEPESLEHPSPTSNETLPPHETNISIASRRHHYPMYLPLLTMLRYCSMIYLGDIVTTSFSSPGIHHTAVS